MLSLVLIQLPSIHLLADSSSSIDYAPAAAAAAAAALCCCSAITAKVLRTGGKHPNFVFGLD